MVIIIDIDIWYDIMTMKKTGSIRLQHCRPYSRLVLVARCPLVRVFLMIIDFVIIKRFDARDRVDYAVAARDVDPLLHLLSPALFVFINFTFRIDGDVMGIPVKRDGHMLAHHP